MPKEKDAPKKIAKKPPTPRRTRVRKAEAGATHEVIAERAYYIALETGGDPFENWLRAERELVTA